MSFSIDTSTEITKVVYGGTLDNKDIQGVLNESMMMKGKDIKLNNRIEDMRKLKGVRIGFAELMEFTDILRSMELPRIVKTAILTGNPLQYGIARMFQSILEHPQMKIKIFTNEEEAGRWLKTIEP